MSLDEEQIAVAEQLIAATRRGDEKAREQTERSLNDPEHGCKAPWGDDTGKRTASSRIDTKTICKVSLQATVNWTNSSVEVVAFSFPGDRSRHSLGP